MNQAQRAEQQKRQVGGDIGEIRNAQERPPIGEVVIRKRLGKGIEQRQDTGHRRDGQGA